MKRSLKKIAGSGGGGAIVESVQIVGLGWHRRCETLQCVLGLALAGNDAV